uniref:Uncharacterized protein n=1 Tax=Rhizophora mucronata TaxID=61149 RepID=A0A2P2N421_RHIMU
MTFLLGITSNNARAIRNSPILAYKFSKWFVTNLSLQYPEVKTKQWSCFAKRTDFLGMHDWRRRAKRCESVHISDELPNASFICPL